MRALSSEMTSITVKSPSMLAEMIARMPNHFDTQGQPALPASEPTRPSQQAIEASILDEETDWSKL